MWLAKGVVRFSGSEIRIHEVTSGEVRRGLMKPSERRTGKLQ